MNHALVGGFVLLLGAALIAGALWLASGGAFQKKYDFYLAIEEESVAGLNLNAPVKFNGVDVGKVREIEIDRKHPERVNLLFAIERGTPIKEDTVAVLKTQGLTGIAYVELSGGAHDSAPLSAKPGSEYPVIQTRPSLSARLENVLTSVLAKLDSTSKNINAILSEENQAAFKSALADISTVAHTIAARKETLDAGMADAARTFENSARASARLEPVIDRVGRAAGAVEKMGNEVAATSAGAGKTVSAVGNDVRRFTSETLPELERLLGELSVLFDLAAPPDRANRTQSVRPAVRSPGSTCRTGRNGSQTMKTKEKILIHQAARLFAGGVALMALGACSLLQPGMTPNPTFYSLEPASQQPAAAAPASAPTLIVSPPRAAAGQDSQRIIYLRESFKLEYFAHSEWVEPPARMLAPLIVAAIEHTGAFRAVVMSPSNTAGDLRLDTEIIRLHQDFRTRPSTVRFTLRAALIDQKTRRVEAWREFDHSVPAGSEDAYGGVAAANRAVGIALENLAEFSAEVARTPRR